MCVRVLCIGVRIFFSPPHPCGKASRRRHTCSHLARQALTGSAPGPRGGRGAGWGWGSHGCPGRAASVPSSCLPFYQGTWLPLLIVAFLPRRLRYLFQRWRVRLVAGEGQLLGGIILLHAHVSLLLCLPVFLPFLPFLSANFPRRSSSFCPSHRHEMRSLTHHCTKDDLGTLWKTGLCYFAAWPKVLLPPP